MSTTFARDYHMHGEIAATSGRPDPGPAGQGAGRPRRVQRHRAADQVPGRVLPHLHRLLRPAGRALRGHRRVHQQGAGRGRLLLLVPRSPRRCTWSSGWSTCWPASWSMDPAELRMKNLLRPEQFPYTCPTGWEYDSGDYPRALQAGDGHRRLRRAAPGAGREAGTRRVHGHRDQLLHRGGRRRAAQAHGHPRPGHGRRRRPAGAPDRQGRARRLCADPGPGPRDDVRPDRGPGARAVPGRRRGRARRHRPDPVRAGHLRLPVHAGVRRGRRGGGPQGPRARPDRRRGHARGVAGRPGVGRRQVAGARRPGPGQEHRRDRDGGALGAGAARRGGGPPGRRRPSTTRRT